MVPEHVAAVENHDRRRLEDLEDPFSVCARLRPRWRSATESRRSPVPQLQHFAAVRPRRPCSLARHRTLGIASPQAWSCLLYCLIVSCFARRRDSCRAAHSSISRDWRRLALHAAEVLGQRHAEIVVPAELDPNWSKSASADLIVGVSLPSRRPRASPAVLRRAEQIPRRRRAAGDRRVAPGDSPRPAVLVGVDVRVAPDHAEVLVAVQLSATPSSSGDEAKSTGCGSS